MFYTRIFTNVISLNSKERKKKNQTTTTKNQNKNAIKNLKTAPLQANKNLCSYLYYSFKMYVDIALQDLKKKIEVTLLQKFWRQFKLPTCLVHTYYISYTKKKMV